MSDLQQVTYAYISCFGGNVQKVRVKSYEFVTIEFSRMVVIRTADGYEFIVSPENVVIQKVLKQN